MRRLIFALVLLSTVYFFGACAANTSKPSGTNANAPATPAAAWPKPTIDELASGKKTFEQNCAICHKTDGTGGKIEIEGKKLNPDNLTSGKIKGFSDEKIIGYILNGVEDEGMPAFKDKLSEGEIRDVVKYIRKQFQNK